MPKQTHSKGFTLIELLVVISIIGLLASIILVYTAGAKIQSRNAVRIANVAQITKALEIQYAVNESYPSGTYYSGWDDGSFPQSDGQCWCQNSAVAGAFKKALVSSGILASLPHDPNDNAGDGGYLSNSAGKGFIYISDGQSYVLGTNLENVNATPPAHDAVSTCVTAGNYQTSAGSLSPNLCPQPAQGNGGNGNQGTPAAPVITSIPIPPPVGSWQGGLLGGGCSSGNMMEIIGTGFTSTGNTVTYTQVDSPNTVYTDSANSTDGVTINSDSPPDATFVGGNYGITVSNSNGTSNVYTVFIRKGDCLPTIRRF